MLAHVGHTSTEGREPRCARPIFPSDGGAVQFVGREKGFPGISSGDFHEPRKIHYIRLIEGECSPGRGAVLFFPVLFLPIVHGSYATYIQRLTIVNKFST